MKYAPALALLISAGAAHAGGPVQVIEEPPVAVPQVRADDWTGIYLGLSAVYGSFILPNTGQGGEMRGYGLHAGYLHDFGSYVLGGELDYVSGDIDFLSTNWASTRLKLIGGYDAGRVLAYGFVGMSRHENDAAILGGGSRSDMMTLYGVGAKLAVSRRVTVGAEYFVERGNDFDDSGVDIYNNGLTLSVDYRFSGVPMASVSPNDWTGFYLGLSAVSGSFLLSPAWGDGTGGYGLHAGYLRDFGSFVLGGELAYATGNYDFFYDEGDWTSTRLKLIGGYDVGPALAYGFLGASRHETDAAVLGGTSRSDTMILYGLGTKLEVSPKVAVGMEYFVETNNDFDNSGFELENNGLSLSVDYRF